MDIVISPKYQILIPKEIRKALNIKKGEKFQIFVKGKVITLVPERPLKELRGFLRGMDSHNLREEAERI
ncbi:MAG: AbrB/MazE/SpoVT family DNA-binding domain-containing protein [Candidatus Eremiobacteraeota bacterium]|nr:AbrB/MazE/SpoVT family DNA-binding domain-containing protein [Candidatus Eremiobacteraeota bacterium]